MNTIEEQNTASDITASFHKASELVTSWGGATLAEVEGRTVEDVLTIEGLSLWSVISPILAAGYISRVLSRHPRQVNNRGFFWALAKKTKRLAFCFGMPLAANRKGCDDWPDLPPFLFLGFSYYMYRDTLQPLAARLAKRSGSSVAVLDDLFPMQPRKTPYVEAKLQSIWQHWDADVTQTLRKMCRTLKRATENLAAPSGLPKIVASSGLAWDDVKHIFDGFFGAYLPHLITYGAIALHIIGRHRAALLISPDVHDPRTRIFCLAGKLSGIRTLEVQFGFYGTNDIEWRFFRADNLAVTGEANLQVMMGHGIPREKMFVTGSPRYDSALSCPPELVRNVRNKLGISDSKVMVLFASQPYYYGAFSCIEVRREMIKALFREMSIRDDMVLVVKPHPSEDPAELAGLAKGGQNIYFTDKIVDIRDLIKASDAFVTFFSGTAFDALVMNKPTINLAFPGSCANNLFEHCGATFVARTAEDIAKILHSISTGQITKLISNLAPAREMFLRNWFFKLDGCATERIESIALGMSVFPFDSINNTLKVEDS